MCRSVHRCIVGWLAFIAVVTLLVSVPGALVATTRAAPPTVAPPAAPPRPQALCEPDGQQASGAIYRICVPLAGTWNGDLVVFAHGFVAPNRPIAIPEDQLNIGGFSIADIIVSQGYAFATTSYSTNGLAVREGLADVVDLVAIFKARFPTVKRIYLLGASMGGLVTTLGVEQYPQLFSGGSAVCGMIGGLRTQVNYIGDFRVVFDYFFPGLMPGTAVNVPPDLLNNWDAYFQTSIVPEITKPTSAISMSQMLAVTGAPIDSAVPSSVLSTTYTLLWYNVFATNDALQKLGGQPFDNQTRVYQGSADDARLNAQVQRFTADPAALVAMTTYESSGSLTIPLVTAHTTLDPLVPYFHETLYKARVVALGRTARYDHLRVERYGHCTFNALEAQQALGILLNRVANPPLFRNLQPLIQR